MAKVHLLDQRLLDIMLSRLSQHVLENHSDLSQLVILGLQPRGIHFAERIRRRIAELSGTEVPCGYIDATFDRDDFRRRPQPLSPNKTKIDFLIEGKKALLIDDVLYTGRTIRAAMNAMLSYGRPDKIELLVLIDRKYSRDLPIEPNYTGKTVNTIQSQRVIVEWREQGFEQDNIWLANQ